MGDNSTGVVSKSQPSEQNDNLTDHQSPQNTNVSISQIDHCSGSITKISYQGIVTLTFNQDVKLTEEFNNNTVMIEVLPSDPLALGDFNLTWKVLSITS